MQAAKVVGPDAPSQKYDLLAALGSHALAADPGTQRLVLRLITLVTARYDWRRGLMSVGQREIARLWSVDERTVKREMARLRDLGWIVLRSQGRRGRVASYALDLTALRGVTREAWARIGRDFEARMDGGLPRTGGGTVVPFPQADRPESVPADEAQADEGPAADDGWEAVRRRLREEDAAVFASWFAPLRSGGRAGGRLTLLAPTAFDATYIRGHYLDRLLAAVRRCTTATEVRLLAAAPAGG